MSSLHGCQYFELPISIYAVIETAVGLEQAFSVCKDSRTRLQGLFVGTADYALDTRAFVYDTDFTYLRQRVVNAARAFELEVIDAPLFQLDDLPKLEQTSVKSFKSGFSGRAVVHPSQIETVNRSYTPSPQDVTHAQEILDNAANARHGVIRSRDGMIGTPFVQNAARVVNEAALRAQDV